MKTCYKCKITDSDEVFTKKNLCVKCNRVQSRLSRVKIRSIMREWLDSLKDHPCTDCKLKWPPYIMEWDHTTDVKNFSVSDAIWMSPTKSKQKVLDEIALCELVCANCHRIRTHKRRNIT